MSEYFANDEGVGDARGPIICLAQARWGDWADHKQRDRCAAFIRRAVNCHNELLVTLKVAQARLFVHEGNSDVYEQAKAAIAKVDAR